MPYMAYMLYMACKAYIHWGPVWGNDGLGFASPPETCMAYMAYIQWGPVGAMTASASPRLRKRVGALWGTAGTMLGPSGAPLGHLWGTAGAMWEP